MDAEDKKLIIAIRSGDEKAFERLFLKYYESLSRFAYQYVEVLPNC